MKFIKGFVVFFACLILAIAVRYYTVADLVDNRTGFFVEWGVTAGIVATAGIFALAAVSAIIVLFIDRGSLEVPQKNAPLSVSSVLVGVFAAVEALSVKTSAQVTSIHISILQIASLLAAMFFIFYGVLTYLGIKIPKAFFCLPVIYLIVKLTIDFLIWSPISLISDTAIAIVGECVMLIFFLNIAKLYTEVESFSARKLTAFGFAGALIMLSSSIAQILFTQIGGGDYSRYTVQSAILYLCMGIFAVSFIASFHRLGEKENEVQ